MNHLRFYHIRDDYAAYLHRVDSRVQFNKNMRRPYVGVVLSVHGMSYYVPLESPKPGHAGIKSGGPVLKLDEGKLGIMGFNNMIPVRRCCLVDFDIASVDDSAYQTLLLKQLHFCSKNRNLIMTRAQNTYAKAVSNKNPFYSKICCDFKKLESACRRYNPNWKPRPRTNEKEGT